jgi:hypothetical protein
MTGTINGNRKVNPELKACYHRSSTNMISVTSIAAIYSVTDKLLKLIKRYYTNYGKGSIITPQAS